MTGTAGSVPFRMLQKAPSRNRSCCAEAARSLPWPGPHMPNVHEQDRCCLLDDRLFMAQHASAMFAWSGENDQMMLWAVCVKVMRKS